MSTVLEDKQAAMKVRQTRKYVRRKGWNIPVVHVDYCPKSERIRDRRELEQAQAQQSNTAQAVIDLLKSPHSDEWGEVPESLPAQDELRLHCLGVSW